MGERRKNLRENRGRLKTKEDVRYSKGRVNGTPIHRSEGFGKKKRVVQSEERLMTYNWRRGGTCEAV